MKIQMSSQDGEKFELIYHQYANKLFHYIYGIVREAQPTEDAFQETFLRIAKNIDKVVDVESKQTKNYLYTIANHEALRQHDKRKREKDVTQAWDDGVISNEEWRRTSEVLSTIELKENMSECISRLSESDANIIILKYEYDLPDADISKMLQIQENAVRQRLFRARKRLAEIIEDRRREGYDI